MEASVTQALSELGATATATARFPRQHVLRYRTSLATPLATAVAIAVAANSDSDSGCIPPKELRKIKGMLYDPNDQGAIISYRTSASGIVFIGVITNGILSLQSDKT